ncbi:MAG: DUF3473 domain-containing protein [Phycisphaerales bacterium]|nr:DUF3473 domain-containing protein [Phycisphaerales bacterium]
MAEPRRVLLSFDVEEFDAPPEFGQPIADADQLRIGAEGWSLTLDLLARLALPATLFTTARIAEHRPDLLRRSLALGCEIASHGLRHTGLEIPHLAQSREILARLSGAPVVGFRAARLAAVPHDAIADAGYLYNSSENPTWIPGRYNNFFRTRKPYTDAGGRLLNIPASVTPIVRFPMFWLSFKNAPLPITRAAAAWILAADGVLNLYFHPWEFTDLSPWRLPPYMKRLHGPAMLDRLERYLAWLARRATFETFAAFAERRRRESPR